MSRKEIVQISPASIGGEVVQAVDARTLHQSLGIVKPFADWMKAQIQRVRLTEGRDFAVAEVFHQEVKNSGGRPRTEYALTIEAAKHIAMMCGSDKGFEVRDYFIECERIAKQATAPALTNEELMAHALIAADATIKAKDAKIARLEPKALAHDRIADADGTLCITDAAKTLQVGQKVLFSYMRGHRWIYSRPGTSDIAHQDKINSGLLAHKVTAVQRPDGTEKIATQVRVTPKGLVKLAALLDSATA